jgi:hypothetical protein
VTIARVKAKANKMERFFFMKLFFDWLKEIYRTLPGSRAIRQLSYL